MAICTGSAAGQLARQVVVDAPGEAGAGDQQRARDRADACALPGQQRRAGEDGERAEQQPAVDVLAEHHPGDGQRGEALEIEQQRGRWRRPSGPARTSAAAAPATPPRDHHGAEPRQVAAAQRRLGRAGATGADRPTSDAPGRCPRRDRAGRPAATGRRAPSSSLASGVLAPNRAADRRASGTPGQRWV